MMCSSVFALLDHPSLTTFSTLLPLFVAPNRWQCAIIRCYLTFFLIGMGLPLYICAVKNKSAAKRGQHNYAEQQVTHVQVQPGAAPGKEKDEQSQLDQGLDG